jgi:gluconolactonase
MQLVCPDSTCAWDRLASLGLHLVFFLGTPASILAASALQSPRHFRAAPGDRQVVLGWETAPGAAAYHVKRGTTASGPLTTLESAVSGLGFTDSQVNNGVNYFYVVSAVAAARESAETPRLRVTPSAPVLDWLPAGAKVEKLAGGFQFIEGPVWVPREGGYLIFSDINANRLIKWTPAAGAKTFRSPSGQANGNTLDREGRLLTGEHANRRVTRTELDGTVTALVTQYNGKRFNAPNDVVVKSDGTVWFTDPNYGSGQLQPGRYVFRFDPSDGNGTVTPVVTNFDQPNGLAFSPDERLLYVADSGAPHHVRVFDVLADHTLANSRVFATINPGVPDGMRVDAQGRLFSSAGDGVQIFSPAGALLGKIRTPETAANVGFGGANHEMLFITANTSLYGITRLPDLVVTAVARSPAAPVAGQLVSFRVVVKNQGTGPTPAGVALRVDLTIDGVPAVLWSDAFSRTLPPDASVVLDCEQGSSGRAWLATAGTHTLRASVDDPRRVAESNELNNGLNANFAVAAPPLDSDGDGASDPDETVAGTDAQNAASVLRILAIERLPDDQVSLTWASVAGKRYRLTCKTSVDDSEWADVGEAVEAQGETTAWRSPLPSGAAQLFLRVRLEP